MIDPVKYKHVCNCADCQHLKVTEDKLFMTGQPIYVFDCEYCELPGVMIFYVHKYSGEYQLCTEAIDCQYYIKNYIPSKFQLF